MSTEQSLLYRINTHVNLEMAFEEKFYNFFIGKGFSKRKFLVNRKDSLEGVENLEHKYRIIPRDYIDNSVVVEHPEHTGRIITSLSNFKYREGNLYFRFLDKEYPLIPSHYEGYNFIEMRDVFVGLSKLGKVTHLFNLNSVSELECDRLRIVFGKHKFFLFDNSETRIDFDSGLFDNSGTRIDVDFGNLTISNKITARACGLIIEIEKEMLLT